MELGAVCLRHGQSSRISCGINGLVTTDAGRFSLLMRFADAMAELDGVDGVQVHRSYWVARKAVEGAVRRNGRHYVTLIDGSEVPVSRSYRRNAESAGLI